MGQMLIKTVMHSATMHLVGAIEQKGHDWVGREVGGAMGSASMGVIVTDDAATAISGADAVIDFTIPQATVAFADMAAAAGVAHIIGTTGFDAKHLAQIANSAKKNSNCASWEHVTWRKPPGQFDQTSSCCFGRRF
jgi:4-hydroxy-tetrahydrodipicolinate reductase